MIGRLFALNMKALLFGILKIGSGAKKTDGGKTLFVTVVGAISAVSAFGMFFLCFYAMLEPCFSAGNGWMYFATFAIIVFALCVAGTIFTATAAMFGAKDNELLLSMPIKPSAILISRLLALLASEYVLTLIVALAAFILWVAGGYATAAGILFFAIGVALLPPMALSVALLLAWALSMISSRLRHKNIVTLVVSVGFLVAFLYVYMNIQGYLGELLSKGSELAEAFRVAMPPFYAFGAGVANGDTAAGLTFAAWVVLPFAATLLLIGANYRKLLSMAGSSLKTVYREKPVKPKGVLYALTAKELAKFFGKPGIIMNSSIGAVFMLISPIALLGGTGILTNLSDISPMIGARPAALFAAVLAFLGTTNALSASLVSLEGKSLWIIKSVPVPARMVLRSKILTHLFSSSLPCLFASVCFGAVLAEDPADLLLILILPQSLIAFIAVVGLVLNLHFPKLDWMNEIHVVKQGMAAMITMFGSMGLLIALGLFYVFALATIILVVVYMWICAALFCLAGVCAYSWLMRDGAKMFAEL
jgi:ABC-2 type transport system permease protein